MRKRIQRVPDAAREPTAPCASLTRRRLLQGLGASAALSPLLPLLHSASAQEATFPQRLILFWTPHGTVYDSWRPTGTESAFTLGPILQPLAPFQSRLCVLDGLDITHSAVPAPPHTEGIGLVWTGSNLGAGTRFMTQEFPHDWVEGPSVDQVVATRIGTITPY